MDHALLHRRMRIKTAGGDPNTDSLCGLCHLAKPISEFSPNRRLKHGLSNTCRLCEKSYMKSYRKSYIRIKAPRVEIRIIERVKSVRLNNAHVFRLASGRGARVERLLDSVRKVMRSPRAAPRALLTSEVAERVATSRRSVDERGASCSETRQAIRFRPALNRPGCYETNWSHFVSMMPRRPSGGQALA